MDQRISIELRGLYTDAGLAARMHSHRLLRRTNGWWMHGMRHIPELTNILIHYAKTTRHVPFLSHVTRLHSDFQIKCDSMKLLTDMKTNIKHAVYSSYEFDTSRAPDSISRNASRAQALLAKTTFVYRVRLIASHLQSTEHRHMILRILTLARASPHVIHIDTLSSRKLLIKRGSRTRTTSALSSMNISTLSHSKS